MINATYFSKRGSNFQDKRLKKTIDNILRDGVRKTFFFLLSLCLIPLFGPPQAFAFPATVERVVDGDTLVVSTHDNKRIRVQLYGIDCPEKNQPYGNNATELTRSIAESKQVEIEPMDIDCYKRLVAIVHLREGFTLQEYLLKNGAAWVYSRYCQKNELCRNWHYREEEARNRHLGLWQDSSAIPPWEWRRR